MISRLKLQLRGSILLIHFQPVYILWTFFLELFGTKKSFNFYISLSIFSFLILWLFVFNFANVSDGITFLHGVMLLFFWLSVFFYLHLLSQNNNELIFLCHFFYSCICLSFIFTYFFFNDLVINRQVIYLFSPFENSTTTGYINIMTMITSIIMFLRKPSFPLLLIITFTVSIIWANRTGVSLCLIMYFYNYFLIKKLQFTKLLLYISIPIFIYFLFYDFLIQSNFGFRIATQGIESVRWIMALEALDALFNGQNLMGGFESNLPTARPWIHNGFLDLYRVGGIVPLLLAVVFFFVTLYLIFKNKNDVIDRIVLWLFGLLIFSTSVAFEGYIYESVFIFILISNTLFLNRNYNRIFIR